MLNKNSSDEEFIAHLLASPLAFTQTFYKLLTRRDFIISQPVSNESHFITICRDLKQVFELNIKNLLINVPPGWGKSILCKFFVAWAMAHYPDSNFLYISHAYNLAEKHTHEIKCIMELPLYKKLFGVDLASDTQSKGYFRTTKGGTVRAFGLSSGVTGHDAGLPGLDRFSGAAIIDDAHDAFSVHSETIRTNDIESYRNQVLYRLRGINVPLIVIGQRLREDDLSQFIIDGNDGRKWIHRILEAEDVHGNPRYPEVHPKAFLDNERKHNKYNYAAQFLQRPQPASGGIFSKNDFYLMDSEPDILATFITVDTAETDKTYNDPTVFSFWGLHKVHVGDVATDMYGLHWIDCVELRIEPKDLEPEFLDFYVQCNMHRIKPRFVAIEKKSTGVTLSSTLSQMQGLNILNVERTRASGNKTTRYLEMAPYVAKKLISLPRHGKHTAMVINHMGSITANDTHRHDDICDTCYDAVQIALINGSITNIVQGHNQSDNMVKEMWARHQQISRMRNQASWHT